MQAFIIEFMNKGFGYFGITFLIAIENIFPPIPSEVILTLSGFMTSYTKMTILGVIVFSTLGSIVGALLLYYIGYLLNERRIKRIINSKLGKILCLKDSDIDKAMLWFKHKGNKTVFFCRFVPVIRSIISIPAGTSKMRITPFVLFTLLGSLIWNTILVVLGRLLGDRWDIVVNFVKKYSAITIILIIIILVVMVVYLRKKRKSKN